ncbi:hypothetical protein [[Pseudopropionibacterium] massiliense]|uniref:hypothetical protein n=1 Tax=[Pseudopropionibacterium] massiliense TaxID=2220000 RepID=UPI00102FFB8A|nr:hypothetical protein [[Pseudopropionibacterium] massiliense]
MLKPLAGIAGMVLTVSLAACVVDATADPGDPGTEESPIGLPIMPAPTALPSNTVVVEPPATHMEAIRTDLNERGVAGSEATLVEAHRKTWRSGALGCPIPGAVYTQALVDGWQVVVKVGDTTYDYRFGSTPSPMLCENSLPTFVGAPTKDPSDI